MCFKITTFNWIMPYSLSVSRCDGSVCSFTQLPFHFFLAVLESVCFGAIEHVWEIKWGIYFSVSRGCCVSSQHPMPSWPTPLIKKPLLALVSLSKAPPFISVFSLARACVRVHVCLRENVGWMDVTVFKREVGGLTCPRQLVLLHLWGHFLCWKYREMRVCTVPFLTMNSSHTFKWLGCWHYSYISCEICLKEWCDFLCGPQLPVHLSSLCWMILHKHREKKRSINAVQMRADLIHPTHYITAWLKYSDPLFDSFVLRFQSIPSEELVRPTSLPRAPPTCAPQKPWFICERFMWLCFLGGGGRLWKGALHSHCLPWSLLFERKIKREISDTVCVWTFVLFSLWIILWRKNKFKVLDFWGTVLKLLCANAGSVLISVAVLFKPALICTDCQINESSFPQTLIYTEIE